MSVFDEENLRRKRERESTKTEKQRSIVVDNERIRDAVRNLTLVELPPRVEGWMTGDEAKADFDARTLVNGQVSASYPPFGFKPTDGLPIVPKEEVEASFPFRRLKA